MPRRKSSDLPSYIDRARRQNPSSSGSRYALERQYRNLIAHPKKVPGTLQIYKRDRIGSLTAPQLRKLIADAHRRPSFK